MTDTTRKEPPPDDRRITSVGMVVDRLRETAQGERTTIEGIVDCLGRASFVPVLMGVALAVVTPLSGIPLFSSFSGILIALVAGQLVIGRHHLWLPGWLMRRSVPSDRLRDAADWLKGPADWIDRHTGKRLSILVSPPGDRLIFLACTMCGAAMPFFEIVPFSSSLLGAAVALLSLTVLVCDGLLALAGLGTLAGAIALLFFAL